jgi:hypothetical protein
VYGGGGQNASAKVKPSRDSIPTSDNDNNARGMQAMHFESPKNGQGRPSFKFAAGAGSGTNVPDHMVNSARGPSASILAPSQSKSDSVLTNQLNPIESPDIFT